MAPPDESPLALPNADPTAIVQGGGMVAMVGPGGWRGTFPADKVADAIAHGFRPEAQADHQERRMEQLYGDSSLRAGLEGAARGATFGLSDVALAGLGADTEGLRERKERNPWASGIGEATGAVGALAATGGLGGLAEGAGAGVARTIGSSGILSRAAAAGARGAVEGGALGFGQGVSHLALSKDPLTAESLVGQLGHDSLVGALTGGAIGGGLSLAGAGLKAAAGKAGQALSKTQTAIRREPESGRPYHAPAGHEDLSTMGLADTQAGIKAETEAIKVSNAQAGSEVAKDIVDFREGVRQDWQRMQSMMPEKQGIRKEFWRAEKRLSSAIEIPKEIAEDPRVALKAVRSIQEQASKFEQYLPEGMLDPTTTDALRLGSKAAKYTGRAASIAEQAEALENRIMDLSGDAAKTSERLDALKGREALLTRPEPQTRIIDTMSKGIGGAIGGLIGHAIPIPFAGVAGAWMGKELAGATLKPVMQRILGVYAENAGAIAQGADA